jgi:Rap1a immunity proteins
MVAKKERTMKRRQKPFLLAVLAALTVMTVTAVRAQPMADPAETDFQAKTTGDLVRLCEASATDDIGIAALHFCHGFAVGAYQYHQIAAAAQQKPPLFCEPKPLPTRNEAIAGFVSWAKQNPGAMDTPPAEGIFRYLAQRYPCRR